METIKFDKLLMKTAFCCMVSDGDIDNKEITLIKSMCNDSPLFKDIDVQEEINRLVDKINEKGTEFISEYFNLLKKSFLTEKEELTLVDFAIKIIKADDIIEYSEIKFFKNIRHRLNVSDESIYEAFPDFEEKFLEEDIITDSYLDDITKEYLDVADLPHFDSIIIRTALSNELKKNQ